MEYYNNKLAIPASWLIASGIMSKVNYDQLNARKSIQVLRRGCNNTPALVDYESMPERFKRKVVAIVKDPYKAVRTNQVEALIKDNAQIANFFDTYLLADGRHLPANSRQEYYFNAIILDAIHELLINKRAKRSALGSKMTRAWDQISEAVQEIDQTKYPHALPMNARRLENRYKIYKKEGLESLISKKFLNGNAAKIDNEVKQSVIVEFLSDPRNLDNSQVRSLYNIIAEKMGWKKITDGTVAVWREKFELEIYAGRRGSVAFSNRKSMHVKRSAPTYPLYFWTLDGWDVELMYQETTIDKKGHSVTTYTNRPTVVVVLDACCKYPIGYAVGTHETPELIQAALRNAATHTAALFGQMMRTQQIQSDRYAISKMMPFYNGMGERVTPARARNAKAKVIEPYFGSVNKRYCQLLPNWSGFGITSNKDKQPNTEYLNKYKSSFPDFDGCCAQVSAIIERERADKVDQYLALYNQMPEEHKITLSEEQYLLLFGQTTGQKNLLQGSGLKITINGVKRDYDCFDTNFRRHASTRWEVRYDPSDLTKVLAVNEDETLRFMLEEKHVQPMALVERQTGDSDQLQRVRQFNEQMVKEVTDFRDNSANIVREHIGSIKELDTLKKLLITDSAGQHKNQRNKQKLFHTSAQTVEAFAADVEEDIFDLY